MEAKEFTPQATRIKEFVDKMKITPTEFGRECGFKSPRTMQAICTDGNAPTTKALTKIVERFPLLNYDWVLLGVGEMVNVGFEKNNTPASINKSTNSSFTQINKKLAVNDLAVNELGVDIARVIKTSETNMLVYTQSMAVLTNKIEGMSNTINDTVSKLLEAQKIEQKFVIKELGGIRKNAEELEIDNRALIRRLDLERKKINDESFEKLSVKIHNYLKESREMQKDLIKEEVKHGIETGNNYLAESRDLQEKLMIKINDKAIKKLIEQMNDNAVKQTDIAIKTLLEKFSLKKILPKIGSHSKVKKD